MKRSFVAVAMAAAATTGCLAIDYKLQGYPPDGALMTAPKGGSARKFTAKAKAWYVLWGLVPISKPTLNSLVRKETGGKTIANVRIVQQMEPVDGAISVGGPLAVNLGFALLNSQAPNQTLSVLALPLSMAMPTVFTVTVEGDVVE